MKVRHQTRPKHNKPRLRASTKIKKLVKLPRPKVGK